jgi:hypothetical protein
VKRKRALPRNSFSSAWARAVFFFLPYASALIPHGTASALRSSLSIEFDEVEAEFPGLSSKTNLLAMLTATLLEIRRPLHRIPDA